MTPVPTIQRYYFYFLNYPVLFFLNSLCLLFLPSFQCYQSRTDNSMPVMLILER